MDGVAVARPDRPAGFAALPAPSDVDVAHVTALVAERVVRLLVRRGRMTEIEGRRLFEEIEPDAVDPLLATCQAASVRGRIGLGPRAGQRVPRLGDRIEVEAPGTLRGPRCAQVGGFSLHADVAVPARDRARLERLARYVGRPALATERLHERSDGQLVYELKRPWREDCPSHCTSSSRWW